MGRMRVGTLALLAVTAEAMVPASCGRIPGTVPQRVRPAVLREPSGPKWLRSLLYGRRGEPGAQRRVAERTVDDAPTSRYKPPEEWNETQTIEEVRPRTMTIPPRQTSRRHCRAPLQHTGADVRSAERARQVKWEQRVQWEAMREGGDAQVQNELMRRGMKE